MIKYDLEIHYRDEKTADIKVYSDDTVEYNVHKRALGEIPFMFDNPTVAQVELFIGERCVPKNRANIQEYLNKLGLEEYDPLEIVRKTHGTMFEDGMWIKFKGEEITWKEVKIRD